MLQLIIIGMILFVFLGLMVILFVNRKHLVPQNKYPKGHFMGVGMSLGMPFGFLIGIPLGIMLDTVIISVTLSPVLGAILGVILGSYLEHKNKDKIRKLTKEEMKVKKVGILFTSIVLLVGLLVISFLILR